MLVAVTFSTDNYKKARKYSVKMAYKKGKVDKVYEFDENDLESEFKEKNKKTLSCSRGGGYWIWKPYLVNRTLTSLNYEDYLFYCDSGAFLTKDIGSLILFMEKKNIEALIFEIELIEKKWTKRDIFLELQCDSEEYTDTKQRCATYFLIRKTDKTVAFISEWLKYAQKYELISDEDNVIYQQPNHEGFCENRHDQSIFSVLSKKYGFQAYQDLSQYRYINTGYKRVKEIIKMKKIEEYPVMICLHRQKKADWSMRFRQWIVDYLPELRKYVYLGYR